MGEVDLMALYWTVSGPVEVHVGREWSLFDWRDRCAEAAKVGFRGLGLWHADVSHQLETRTLEEMAKIFRDAGLKYLEVEFLWEFFVPQGQPARADSDRLRKQLFETAVAFDAHHIKVGNIPETPCELDRLIEEYAALCDDAAQHTDAKVAYEIIPFDPNVHTLDAGIQTGHRGRARERRAGDRHLAHGQAAHPARRAQAHPRRIPGLGGAVRRPGGVHGRTRSTRSINYRKLPGEGEFDIPGYIEACQAVGYDGPWGVEVLSEELRNLPIEEEFKRAYETTVAQFRAGVTNALRRNRWSSLTTTGSSGCSPRCCGSASSRSASSGPSRSTPA